MQHNQAFWDQMAIDAYRSILRQKPNSPIAHFNLGLAYMRTQRTNKAIRSFLRAVKCDKSSPTPYYHLGKAYLQEGKMQEALRYFKHYQRATDKNQLSESKVVTDLIQTSREKQT